MQEQADIELLRQYAEQNSEEAFAELVTRYVNLVYSAAARKTGNHHAAEEITQAVFIILAKKAGSLRERTILPGWLYQTARLTAANFLRQEIRRRRREQEAYMQSLSYETDAWPEIAPLLEDAMGRLNENERNAIVLRFFEGKNFHEVGAAFGGSDNAAKKRVIRGLEKLRKFCARRGVNSTTAIIGENIAAHCVQAAPAALAKTVAAAAVSKGAAASASILTLIQGALKLMAWTKTKTAIVAGGAVLLAVGTATVILQAVHGVELERKIIWKLDVQALEKEPPVVLIRPAQPIPGVYSGGGGYLGGTDFTRGKMLGLKNSVLTMLMLAYRNSATMEGIHPDRVVFSTKLPKGEYDFIACTPAFQKEGLQQALKNKFNLSAHWESRERNVFLLCVRDTGAPGLKVNETYHAGASEGGKGQFSVRGGSLSLLADFLEDSLLGVPVIDRTELTNSYDIGLTWPTKGRDWTLPKRAELDQILLDQLGLELVSARENVEILFVEKAR